MDISPDHQNKLYNKKILEKIWQPQQKLHPLLCRAVCSSTHLLPLPALVHRLLAPKTDLVRHSFIFNDPEKAEKLFPVPVLQCLQVKQMAPSAQAGERWRLVISDGQHYVQTMLATKANHVVRDGKLERGCFIRVKQYQPNSVKGKKYVMRSRWPDDSRRA